MKSGMRVEGQPKAIVVQLRLAIVLLTDGLRISHDKGPDSQHRDRNEDTIA
jgi:hypothetical protein